jgi:hypothetical protein
MSNNAATTVNLTCVEDQGDERYLLRLMTPYVVQLDKIEPCAMPKGPAYKWHFTVLTGKKFESEDSAKGLSIQHLTSQHLSPSSKLWKMLTRMLARELTVGEQVNPGDLIGKGKYYKIMVEHNESGGKTYNRIIDIAKHVVKKKAKA